MSFTIKELESLSGIKAHTIRIWEQRYQFLKPARTTTNIRRYNNEELKTLLTVALLNKYGYKISRIDEMPQEQRIQAALELEQPIARQEYVINSLIGCMVDLKNIEFEKILNQQFAKNGVEETVTGVIFSFLERVGILWQTSRLRPVQEHITSCIIRQKIIHAIEGLPFPSQESPLFVLFLPEGEHHELGL
ncbi:MAG: MerR family transcriptional regulator, partial [Chitinophagaceae bacterium]